MTKKILRCPSCFDGSEVRRSHLRVRDWPFRLFGMRTYRCMLCYQRFRAWGPPPPTVNPEHHRKHPDRKYHPRKIA
ncbi:MAG: hypothetical protein WA294_16880 [Acidobacteriaceae bacterium]